MKRLYVHLGAVLRTDGAVAAVAASGGARVFPDGPLLDDVAAAVQNLLLDRLLHRYHSHDLRLHRLQGARLARRLCCARLCAVLLVTARRTAMQTLLLSGGRSPQTRPLYGLRAGA